jgi:hypothetical protein
VQYEPDVQGIPLVEEDGGQQVPAAPVHAIAGAAPPLQ